MQLTQFSHWYDEFQRRGIAVYAITAEPGGEDAIRRKLIANGVPHMKVPLFSDPSWSLMTLEPRDKIYVESPSHPFLLKAKQFNQPYRMVQPALVVLDQAGQVLYWWSWNALRAGVLAEDGVLPNAFHEDNVHGNTHDVRWRPVPEDLLRILSEGGDLRQLRVENLGFPDGKDHVNVKQVLQRNPAEHARQRLREGAADKVFNKEVQQVEVAKAKL